MNKTLVILAAGIGSRYGGGIKQIEPVGPNGEIIIDYSIHDAIAAGFNKVVLVIRRDIEKDVRDVIGDRLSEVCDRLGVEFRYAFQEHPLNDPEKFPEGRKKPWGTGHAVMACDGIVDEPFAVINADDYYGKEGFAKAADLLEKRNCGMIGYRLGNTLSENGAVTRGICKVEEGKLTEIVETPGLIKKDGGAEAHGETYANDTVVSMNFWCFPTEMIEKLKGRFPDFISGMKDPVKDEFLLPSIVEDFINEGTEVYVSESSDRWFGVTYQEDKEHVINEFRKLYENGVYSEDLYSDL